MSKISHIEAIYSAAIAAVSPVKLVSEALQYDPETKLLTVSDVSYPLNRSIITTNWYFFVCMSYRNSLCRNVKVVAFGKAVLGMVTAVERLIGEHIVEGVASIPVGAMETAKVNFPQHLPLKTSKVRYAVCLLTKNTTGVHFFIP